jgi:hypothetical protein
MLQVKYASFLFDLMLINPVTYMDQKINQNEVSFLYCINYYSFWM